MKISQPHQIVVIQLLNNANFGAASGKVTLDRPTQLDAYLGLPFIPNSSLRGVMRNWWEFQDSQALQTELLFGTKDNCQNKKDSASEEPAPEKDHKTGKLVIGNGELLAFPLLTRDGSRCWVLPLETICKYIAIEKLYRETTGIKRVINSFYTQSGENITALGIPELPSITAPFGLRQLSIETDALQAEIQSLYTVLCRWWGDWIPQNEAITILKAKDVQILWQHAAEIRDLTAVNKQKTALSQSLRRIETIPEGSLFLSLFTWLDENELDFSGDVIQIGSNEGTALGFSRMKTTSLLDPPTKHVIPDYTIFHIKELPHKSMEKMHQQLLAIARENNKNFRKKLKTIIRDLGWRLKKDGYEPAIAFALAQAHPNKDTSQLRDEEKAYRWLLKTLFDKSNDIRLYDGRPWFYASFDEAEKAVTMQRWEWLKKFSETELI